MGMQPDARLGAELSALLSQEQSRIITHWVGLLRDAQPQLVARMAPTTWSGRAVEALGVMRSVFAEPELLRYPVLAPGEAQSRIRGLAARAVMGPVNEHTELHNVQGAYFLLQEALVDVLSEHFGGDRRAQAILLVDRFIKQLSIAMSEAIIVQRTQGLEEAVASRTRHLEELLRKEGEFLGFISHEVRTGLTAILGACDFLREINEEPLSETQGRYVRMIERSGELIHTLVNDILDYAKIESGRVTLRLEPINLREVATDAIALLEAKWEPKGLEVVLDVPAELPDIKGDRIRLQQIFLNLLANAIRFSPMGARVVVRGGLAGRTEWIEVEDEGPGVPRADRSRIFERFQQLENAFSRGEGTGLGLPIVKLLTEMHGGHIEVLDPDAHEGGLFRVSLPLPDGHRVMVGKQTG